MKKTTHKFKSANSQLECYEFEIKRLSKKSPFKEEIRNAKSITAFFKNGSRIRKQNNLSLKIWEK